MFRLLAMVAALLPVAVCLATDLTLNDGTALREVRLLRRELGRVSIMHKTGGGTYSISDFDEDSRNWIRNYRAPCRVVGRSLTVDEDVSQLAAAIVKQMSGLSARLK